MINYDSITEEEFIRATSSTNVFKRTYFIQTEGTFILNKEYSIHEKIVYQALCVYAGQNTSCFPGQELLASNLAISESTLKRTLKSLEQKNGIVTVARKTTKGRKTSNLYILAEVDKVTGKFLEETLIGRFSLRGKTLIVEE